MSPGGKDDALHRPLGPSLPSVADYHIVLPIYSGRIFQEGNPIKFQEVKTTFCIALYGYLYPLLQAQLVLRICTGRIFQLQ